MSAGNSDTNVSNPHENTIGMAVAGGAALILIAALCIWAHWLTRRNHFPWKYLNACHLRRRNAVAHEHASFEQMAVSITPSDTMSPISPTHRRGTGIHSPTSPLPRLHRIDEEHGLPTADTAPTTSRLASDWALLRLQFYTWLDAKLAPKPEAEPLPATAQQPPPPRRRNALTISAPVLSPTVLRRLEETYVAPRPAPTRTMVRKPVAGSPSPTATRFTRTFDDLPEECRVRLAASPRSVGGERRASEATVFRAHPGTRMTSF